MVAAVLRSPSQTRALGRVLAGLLRPPALVTVEGDLGAGKTTLVRAALRARGVRGLITSPSFTIAQSYRGRDGERLHHLDLYRLTPGADVSLFAWEDYLTPDALTFVEWPEAGAAVLPAPDVRVRLAHRTRTTREARLAVAPALEAALLAALAAAGVEVRAVAAQGEGARP